MTRTTILAPSPPAVPVAVPIRPSDRLASAMPRSGPTVIPVRPRRDSILVEGGPNDPAARLERLRRELEALDFSTELL